MGGVCGVCASAPAAVVKLEGDGPDLEAKIQKAEAEIDEMIQTKRINMGTFIRAPAPTEPDERLLRAVAAATIFAATETEFAFFTDAADASVRLNDLSIQMSPASMNFGCTALRIIFELAAEISAAGVGVHNTPMSEAQLSRALRLKAMWRKMIQAHSIRTYPHPRLGTLPVVQPLVHTLVQWRGAGHGNGVGEQPDPIFPLVLARGARVDIHNSLGLSLMHALVEAAARAGSTADGDGDAVAVASTLNLARLLLAHGASPSERSLPFARASTQGYHPGLELMLAEPRGRDAVEACRWLHAREPARALEQLARVLDEHAAAQPRGAQPAAAAREAQLLGPRSAGFVADRASHPAARADLPVSTWVQAVFNVAWLVSQLTALETTAERRALLTELAPAAPFQLPLMVVVPWSELRALGRFPRRDTSQPGADGGWAGPTPVALLGADARVVFLSHRWLRPAHPDDEEGTKFRQVAQVMGALGAALGCKAENLHLWLDFSCIDQSNPFPGVQMLPAIMACCEEFVYVEHEAYSRRAWCRTEVFFHWRLRCHTRKWRLNLGGGVREEPRVRHAGDPALGELYSEADRVALVNMTSFFDDRPDD